MSKNLEKWNGLMAIIENRLLDFVIQQCGSIPEKFYSVYPTGKVEECFIIKPYYRYEFEAYYRGKSPTKQDVTRLWLATQSEIDYSLDNVYFDYFYYYMLGEEKRQAKTAVKYKDLFPPTNNIFLNKDEADAYGDKIQELRAEEALFDETHKKDKHYDYRKNGYKDLGWQNSWKHVYYDEDGKITTGDVTKGEKPKKTFGYTKEDYPEYGACRESKHRTIEVNHDNRGTQHDVSCPICKIVYHYDSSD
jgi:hypothetical protein